VVQCHPWCLALLYGYYGLTVLGYLTGLTAFGTTFPFFCFWIGVIVWAFLHALVTEPDPFLKKQINLSLTAPVFAGLFAVFYLLPGVLGLPPVPLTYFALLSLIIPYALPLAMDTRRLYTERLALEQRQRQQERQAQAAKERLERDLHDLVLNNLVVIAHALEALLRHRDQESERLLARLQSIESLVRETSRQMRDLLEVINERYHSWEAFCAYLRQWSYRVVEHAALEFAFESAPALATLPAPTPLLRAGLYCIYREAVLNALRHAQATRIQGSLRVCAQALICEVHDNGVGFEPRQVPIGHQGLTNMRKRASELGGVLTLETAPGHGTRLFCRLPVGGTTASAG
jgi:signal transduction histidine kinase